MINKWVHAASTNPMLFYIVLSISEKTLAISVLYNKTNLSTGKIRKYLTDTDSSQGLSVMETEAWQKRM